jgi:hypothetical protein
MGWFLLIAWPIVIPYFMINREGRRGLRRIGIFVLAVVSAAIARGVTTFLIGGE